MCRDGHQIKTILLQQQGLQPSLIWMSPRNFGCFKNIHTWSIKLFVVRMMKDGGLVERNNRNSWLQLKLKMNISQQILALDARYNAYRVQNNPQYRKYRIFKPPFIYLASQGRTLQTNICCLYRSPTEVGGRNCESVNSIYLVWSYSWLSWPFCFAWRNLRLITLRAQR